MCEFVLKDKHLIAEMEKEDRSQLSYWVLSSHHNVSNKFWLITVTAKYPISINLMQFDLSTKDILSNFLQAINCSTVVMTYRKAIFELLNNILHVQLQKYLLLLTNYILFSVIENLEFILMINKQKSCAIILKWKKKESTS
jgi:hypothetical protein